MNTVFLYKEISHDTLPSPYPFMKIHIFRHVHADSAPLRWEMIFRTIGIPFYQTQNLKQQSICVKLPRSMFWLKQSPSWKTHTNTSGVYQGEKNNLWTHICLYRFKRQQSLKNNDWLVNLKGLSLNCLFFFFFNWAIWSIPSYMKIW